MYFIISRNQTRVYTSFNLFWTVVYEYHYEQIMCLDDSNISFLKLMKNAYSYVCMYIHTYYRYCHFA